MRPIGLLMIEHRLIERMISIIDNLASRAEQEGKIDSYLIDTAVDFIRTYADHTHHGKEEDILFRDLAEKKMSREDSRLMSELIDEHKISRNTVGDLVSATKHYRKGEKSYLSQIIEKLRFLAKFYPEHIQKEDKVFFPASKDYFSESEQTDMLAEMWEFDRGMIHEKYKAVVEGFE